MKHLAAILLMFTVLAGNAKNEPLPIKISMIHLSELSAEIKEARKDLEMLGLYSFKYNLESQNEYQIKLTVDEYKNGELTKERTLMSQNMERTSLG